MKFIESTSTSEPTLFCIYPRSDGKFRIYTIDYSYDNSIVDNLYVAMEGFTYTAGGAALFILSRPDDSSNSLPQVIFDVAVTFAGKFFLTTKDKVFTDCHYFDNLAVDNLYVAMEGITRRYRDEYKIVFRIIDEVI